MRIVLRIHKGIPPFCPRPIGEVAQLAEQRTHKPCIAGSSPALTTDWKLTFLLWEGFFTCTSEDIAAEIHIPRGHILSQIFFKSKLLTYVALCGKDSPY